MPALPGDDCTALDTDAGFAETVASLFVAVIGVIRDHPLLERLARIEPQAWLAPMLRA